MFIGSQDAISNRADWTDTLRLYDDDYEPIDLTDATAIAAEIRDPMSRGSVATLSLGSGVTIQSPATAGYITWTFTRSQLESLSGFYEFGIVITIDDSPRQVLAVTLPIIDGIVS